MFSRGAPSPEKYTRCPQVNRQPLPQLLMVQVAMAAGAQDTWLCFMGST